MTEKNRTASEPDEYKPGPEPERLQIECDWEEAMGKALKKKKPADGWPKSKPDQETPRNGK